MTCSMKGVQEDEETTHSHVDYHKVGSTSTVYRRSVTPKRVAALTCCVLMPMLSAGILCYTGLPGNQVPSAASEHYDRLTGAGYSRCTFEDLQNAFHPASHNFERFGSKTTLEKDSQGSEQCWSLEDEILRVPANAIHRRHLVRLGNGVRGAVFKAALDVPQKDGTHKTCMAAIKTDHCNTLSSGMRKKQTRHSCLEPRAFSLNKDSYMSGEYLGSAIYYAIQHMKTQDSSAEFASRAERGLLPTFGLIQDFGHPLWTNHKRSELLGLPHPSAEVKGIVMPLIDFEPLYDLPEPKSRVLLRDAKSIADVMLSAAEGLQLVSGMGLSYRDVTEKNIGIVVEGGELRSMIFDNSYVSIEDQQSCMLPDNQNQGCQFCQDGAMYHTDASIDGIYTDAVALRGIILGLLERTEDASQEKKEFQTRLLHCETIKEIVDVLRAGPR